MTSEDNLSAEPPRARRVSGTSRLEWVVASAGAFMLLAMLGYMISLGLTESDAPPLIALTKGPVDRAPHGFVMQFTARNDGGTTAAGLKVTGQLVAGGEVVEESEATLDYVPERSERQGGLFFSQDPRQHEVRLRSQGYAKP